jgi:hypothetical protein
MTTYDELLIALRKYAKDQEECGNPARMQDLCEFRQWKNMWQNSAEDAQILAAAKEVMR